MSKEPVTQEEWVSMSAEERERYDEALRKAKAASRVYTDNDYIIHGANLSSRRIRTYEV